MNERQPTGRQLSTAKYLGIHVTPSMTFDELRSEISLREREMPETQDLILCTRLGITVTQNMKRRDVKSMIEYARNDPALADAFQRIQAEDELVQREVEKEFQSQLVEQYGVELTKQYLRFEKINDLNSQLLLIFKSGKQIVCDVGYVDGFEIIDGKKPYLRLELLLPKRRIERNFDLNYEYLDWDKTKKVRADKLLHVQQMRSELNDKDISEYERILAIADKQAAKFRESK